MYRSLWTVTLLMAVGCHDGDLAPPTLDLSLGPPAQKDKVDILFVIENIGSSPQTAELKNRFAELVKIIQTFGKASPVSYHIGVVTPDLGIGQAVLGGGQCHPGGDGAKLQALGRAADTTCKPPTGGARFIDYDQIHGTDNLPAGQDLATTFGCIASVGDNGCGFQQLLEASYRALHDPIPENAGFLRDDALLVVFYLVDKDDCSAPPDTDLGDPSYAIYGGFSALRCMHFGVVCGDPPTPVAVAPSPEPLTSCRPMTAAEGTKLIDVQKYIDWWTLPASMGGVKADPRDVILAAIRPPPSPVSFSLLLRCGAPPLGDCIWLNPSCRAPQNAPRYGDPAVRLSTVVSAVATSQQTSSCDASYQSALQSLGQLMVNRTTPHP